MTSFILRRAWHGLIVILGVTVIVFFVTRLVGDPVAVMLSVEATAEQRALLERQLGLDEPILEQFVTFATSVVRLDFGDSLWQRRPALGIVLERLPMTLLLTVTGIGLAILLAIPLGVLAALRPGGWLDRIAVMGSLAGLSLPQFWLGLLLIILFGVQLGWLPTSGARSPTHIILPALALCIPSLGRLTMMVRSLMVNELERHYVKAGYARGLGRLRVVAGHALRNAAAPILTLSGLEVVGALAGNVVVVESVFAWPGIGLTVVQAMERQDLVLLQAVVFTVAIATVTLNLAIDVAQKLIDPRIGAS